MAESESAADFLKRIWREAVTIGPNDPDCILRPNDIARLVRLAERGAKVPDDNGVLDLRGQNVKFIVDGGSDEKPAIRTALGDKT